MRAIRSFPLAVMFALVLSTRVAGARQSEPPAPPAAPEPAPPVSPAAPADPSAPAAPPPLPPAPAEPSVEPGPAEPVALPEEAIPEPMSEGRAIVVGWNTGFQWGLAPGVIFSGGRAAFSLGVRLGWGFDTGSVIVVPGVRLAGYFTDPNVYVGMPVLKLVYPIDRFAPFVEGGGGLGHVAGGDTASAPSATGAALFVGGGFMIHFTRSFALGAEANYQAITGTGFKGFGVGPIIAFAF